MHAVFKQELLGQSKVNHVNLVGFFICSNNEVIRLDVSVDVALAVHELNSIEYLVGDH